MATDGKPRRAAAPPGTGPPTGAACATEWITRRPRPAPPPVAGLLLALTPPPYLNGLIGACALVQALILLVTFLRLRNDPMLRTTTVPAHRKT
ncbi:hypothetical protein SHIRM173S_04083 [Streptomyces hirsutus]